MTFVQVTSNLPYGRSLQKNDGSTIGHISTFVYDTHLLNLTIITQRSWARVIVGPIRTLCGSVSLKVSKCCQLFILFSFLFLLQS